MDFYVSLVIFNAALLFLSLLFHVSSPFSFYFFYTVFSVYMLATCIYLCAHMCVFLPHIFCLLMILADLYLQLTNGPLDLKTFYLLCQLPKGIFSVWFLKEFHRSKPSPLISLCYYSSEVKKGQDSNAENMSLQGCYYCGRTIYIKKKCRHHRHFVFPGIFTSFFLFV